MQICNGKRWVSYNVNFTMRRDGLEMQIFITGIDRSIMMHHWRLLANMSEPSMRGSQGWAVQKQLNWSRCHLGEHSCGPDKLCIRWGEHWRYLVNTIEPSAEQPKRQQSISMYICNSACLSAVDTLECHIKFSPITSSPTMWTYTKILWPFVNMHVNLVSYHWKREQMFFTGTGSAGLSSTKGC